MKIAKRLAGFLLSASIVASLLVAPASAAGTGGLAADKSLTTYGDTIVVTSKIPATNEQIDSFQIDITFDTDKLEVVETDVKLSDLRALTEDENAAGTVTKPAAANKAGKFSYMIAAATSMPLNLSGGHTASIKFKVKDTASVGETTVSINKKVFGYNGSTLTIGNDWSTSATINIKTGSADPSVPEVTNVTDTTITATKVGDQKYMCLLATADAPTADSEGWQDTAEFTGLTPNTAYRIYTFIPETEQTVASNVVYTERSTEKTTITDTLVTVTDLTGKIFTGKAQEPDYGGSLIPNRDYTISYAVNGTGELKDGKPYGAGNYTITVEGIGDYKGSFTKEMSIGKATWSATSATGSTRYGTIGTVNLTDYLAPGGTFGTVTKEDAQSIVSGTPSINGNELSFSLVDDATKAENTATATIKVPVTNATNYVDYEISVVVTMTAKEPQSNFKFAEAAQTKVYGNADFTVAATGAESGSTVSYKSSDTTVATVDNNGKVHIWKAGTATITATASATDTYAETDATYTLTVNKATITIKANNKNAYVGETKPTLGTSDYTVTGLVNGETLTTEPTIAYASEPDMTKAGTVAINVSGAVAPAGDNYNEIVYTAGTLTISTKSSSGGSSSSSSGYSVTVNSTKNGTITVSSKNAKKGDAVTITVKPTSGYELDSLTVTDKNGNTVKLTEKGNGQYTFTMPASTVTVKGSFVATTVAPVEPANPFVDVKKSDYYYDAVQWAVAKGITSGVTANEFKPGSSCSRAQMVTFLWRAAGSPAPTSSVNPFTDVKSDAYYYKAVLWAVEKGITSGASKTTFNPNGICNRSQTVTFLWRAAGSPTAGSGNSFGDVASNAYYTNAVQWAVEKGITSGTTANTFSPAANCTRGQIVTFLYRYMGK